MRHKKIIFFEVTAPVAPAIATSIQQEKRLRHVHKFYLDKYNKKTNSNEE